MKRFLPILLLFISLTSAVSSALAQDLCDVSCDITITFPDGGTLTATEALTFIFGASGGIILGEGGTVNTAIQPASLDFPTGGTVTLNSGESISFGVGGFISTAAGGNFNHTSIEVTTDVEIEAVGGEGNTSIVFGNIAVTGNGELIIRASDDIEIAGVISGDAGVYVSMQNDSELILSGKNTYTGGTTINAGTLIIGVTAGVEGVINVGSNTLNIDNGASLGGSVTVSTGTINVGLNVDLVTVSTGTVNLDEAVIATDFSSVPVGFVLTELVDADGKDCTVISVTRCETADGSIYGWVDGELVLVDGTGALDWKVMLLFACLLFYSRRKSFTIR